MTTVLAAALAFHISMSPPTCPISDPDTTDNRRAIRATARFITAVLTKVRASTHPPTPSRPHALHFETLGPLLGVCNHRHTHLACAVCPQSPLVHHDVSPTLHLHPSDECTSLLDQAYDIGNSSRPRPTHIPSPTFPAALASSNRRRNNARHHRCTPPSCRLPRPRPILRLPKSRSRPMQTSLKYTKEPTRLRTCPRAHHDRTLCVRPASGVRRAGPMYDGSRRAPSRRAQGILELQRGVTLGYR